MLRALFIIISVFYPALVRANPEPLAAQSYDQNVAKDFQFENGNFLVFFSVQGLSNTKISLISLHREPNDSLTKEKIDAKLRIDVECSAIRAVADGKIKLRPLGIDLGNISGGKGTMDISEVFRVSSLTPEGTEGLVLSSELPLDLSSEQEAAEIRKSLDGAFRRAPVSAGTGFNLQTRFVQEAEKHAPGISRQFAEGLTAMAYTDRIPAFSDWALQLILKVLDS
ncbi:hypothetical protein K2X30_09680 [bacterium]|jgi:hypothetical protein|nr:hypothetical protein [bacterium]